MIIQYVTVEVRDEYWSEAKRQANVIYDRHRSMMEVDEERGEITLRIVDPDEWTDGEVEVLARMGKGSSLSCWKGDGVMRYDFLGGTREEKAGCYLRKIREVASERLDRIAFVQGMARYYGEGGE